MHSTLFVASIGSDADWAKFLQFVIPKIRDAVGVSRLAENVWLVNFQQSPAALGWLLAFADQQKVAYGLLPFEREPQWLPGGFDPSTIQVRSGA